MKTLLAVLTLLAIAPAVAAGFSLDVGSDGTVYVYGGSDVYEYDPAGGLIRHLSNLGPSGPIAVDPSNQYFYLCGGNVVAQYTVTGAHIRSWVTWDDSRGENQGIAVGPGGDVYVTDGYTYRINQFTGDGVFVRYWGGGGGSADGEFLGIWGITTDAAGDVYVCDGQRRIQKFTANGAFLTKWGTSGTEDGQFRNDRDVAVSNDGNVYVVDYSRNDVQVFGVGITPTVSSTWGRLKALYRGAAPTRER